MSHTLIYGNIENINIKKELKDYIDDSIYILEIQCVLHKGIKNIRDIVSSFVKWQNPSHIKFKAIILYDAEYLTIDSQYSLRRTIEIYSKNSRFFIITKNKDKLLEPLRSRFTHKYLPFNFIYKPLINKIDISDYNKLYLEGMYGDKLMRILYNRLDKKAFSLIQIKYNNICSILKNEKLILLYLILFYNKYK